MGLRDRFRRRPRFTQITDLSLEFFGQEIVGESHYQQNIQKAARESEVHDEQNQAIVRVLILREPKNRYDSNAVRIADLEDRTFGYLPREMASWVSPLLVSVERDEAPASCMARISRADGTDSYGVWLDLDARFIEGQLDGA